uniref:Uncharacterized protein n=1 Tax=Chromera velia CCMP2878 TaxID=1169474 RepID=A0A0G4HET6_9ALVE|eukprot:Cvel_26736.t1-p1 / transcript=Cvel_26736.t1 / gene=Cvel_26736 / organism=Chromera_velia_CCMP2878 / gene_product=Actin, putative / transcript_product=Actin, putative / location=Cvel_scaffold3227:9580-11859(-) / protein_length=461 / sequence_SO=supercontig / SO=protein_coding / is_pseudo=false
MEPVATTHPRICLRLLALLVLAGAVSRASGITAARKTPSPVTALNENLDTRASPAIVLDMGDGVSIVGVVGKSEAKTVFPSVVGLGGEKGGVVAVGQEALDKAKELKLVYPIKDHAVVDWDLWTVLVQHGCDLLRVAPEEHSMLVTDTPPFASNESRGEMAEIVLKRLNAPTFFVASRATLALIHSSESVGIRHGDYLLTDQTAEVLVADENGIVVTPIVKGKTVPEGVLKTDIRESDITNLMLTYLEQDGVAQFDATPQEEKKVALDIEEKLGYVALDYEDELEKKGSVKVDYELPDGNVIHVGSERFRAPEALFKPNLLGKESSEALNGQQLDGIQPRALNGGQLDGIHKLTYESIMKCDVDIRRDLYRNVQMSGGTVMFKGIDDRVSRELETLLIQGDHEDVDRDSIGVKIVTSPESRDTVFIGGSILSSLSTFEEMWIKKDEYDQAGPSIVFKKCIM